MKHFLRVAILFVVFLTVYSTCGGTYKDLNGAFTSPNFPDDYPNKQKCTYEFRTKSLIKVKCSQFELEKANKKGRCKDYVQIKDGKTKTKYCGTNFSDEYISTSEKVTILFKSNKKKGFGGFSCTYESVTDDGGDRSDGGDGSNDSELLTKAVAAYNSGTCIVDPQRSTCGCSDPQSEYQDTVIADVRIVVTKGIPNHIYETGQENPNNACEHQQYMAVPLNPVKGTTCQASTLGPTGIAISGGFFFNHLADPGNGAEEIHERESFDTCNGHSDPTCKYHYHMIPVCIDQGENCDLVGYLLDGFTVYSFCKDESETRILKSCYEKTSSELDGSNASHYAFNATKKALGECDLDEANGYEFSDSRGYAYVFTKDYPYIMTCYFGTVTATMCYME